MNVIIEGCSCFENDKLKFEIHTDLFIGNTDLVSWR